MKAKSFFHDLFIEPSIFLVSNTITIISILFPILFSAIRKLFPVLTSDFQLIGFILLCIAMSFNGFIQVYRKEVPGYGIDKSIKGPFAVISGIILFIIFLGGALFLIIGRIIYQNNFF